MSLLSNAMVDSHFAMETDRSKNQKKISQQDIKDSIEDKDHDL